MRREPIEILRFSTADLPPDERYPAWLNWGWPRSGAIFRTDPTEPFDTHWESMALGEIIFVRTGITGMRYERRLGDIRQSDFDPLIVNMMMEGSAQGVFDGREFREEPGSFHFHDITRPSIHVSTASRTFSIVVPRPLAIQLFGKLHDLHGLVVRGGCADLLLAHAKNVWAALPGIDQSSAPALGRSFLDLLAVAVSDARRAEPPFDTAAAKLRQRAATFIESRLNTALSPGELCGALDVSRKSLFAAFRQDGGVQNYIRATRLESAKAALADREREEPIGTIAVRLGFCDASHLSRLFRERYGMTPRSYRRLLAIDLTEPPA
jgi:AraC-like DNA-binding protein